MNNKQIVKVIVGATASGKSKKALELADKYDSVIINADSLQVYEDLPTLTAQPNDIERKTIPHKMYGFMPFHQKINARMWANEASSLIKNALNKRKRPIIVGGTGMYIKCLVDGISELPHIDEDIRQTAIGLSKKNYQKLCEIVYKNDIKLQNLITPSQNRQMIRAYEIFLQTGQSIRTFFEKPKIQFLNNVDYQFIMPSIERISLYENINKRFKQMIKNGAIEEVSILLQKTSGKTNYSVFQAIGALEIVGYLKNELTLAETIDISAMKSRRYAKRQITWIKNQIKNHTVLA